MLLLLMKLDLMVDINKFWKFLRLKRDSLFGVLFLFLLLYDTFFVELLSLIVSLNLNGFLQLLFLLKSFGFLFSPFLSSIILHTLILLICSLSLSFILLGT